MKGRPAITASSQSAAASPTPAWVRRCTPVSCHLCPLPPKCQCTSVAASAPSHLGEEQMPVGGPCTEASTEVKPKLNPRDFARKEEGLRQVLRAGALGRPRGMGWEGRREGGSGWGAHVNPWLIHVNVWQKPYTQKK